MKGLIAYCRKAFQPLTAQDSGCGRPQWLIACASLCIARHYASTSVFPPVQWQRRKDRITTPDTIYALSTAPGRSAIAVIRLSGPACLDIYGALCPNKPFPLPRTAVLRRLHDPDTIRKETKILDNGALILYFPAPRTVTGEDVLELHVHGGPAIVRSVLEAIPKCTDSRPRRRTSEYSVIRHAEPGEFTKRAFYNGRLDLTEAEALGEALAAETEQQRRLAVSGAQSGLAKRYEEWRALLLYARGELEALIDFSEDQHFDESPAQFMNSVSQQVLGLKKQIELHITNASKGELLRSGISIALLGAPNAGKSSLLNRIVGREAAIVSAEAGTTRDIVDVTVDIQGWLCRLGDMAGLRDQSSPSVHVRAETDIGMVEREGIRRARERALHSDVVIVLLEVELGRDGTPDLVINREVIDAAQECRETGKIMLYAINKLDLLPSSVDIRQHLHATLFEAVRSVWPGIVFDQVFLISCRDADISCTNTRDPGGIQAFLQGLASAFQNLTSAVTGQVSSRTTPTEAQAYWTASLSVTHRQSQYLQECLGHLNDFLALSQHQPTATGLCSHHVDGHDDLIHEVTNAEAEVDIVTAAEHLRYAAMCLARITGTGEGGDVEDVLGVVFEK